MFDAASALEHAIGDDVVHEPGRAYCYHRRVSFAPPWSEIYEHDDEQQHGFDTAADEYARLLADYPSLGYDIAVLPRIGMAKRADFILRTLGPKACSAKSD